MKRSDTSALEWTGLGILALTFFLWPTKGIYALKHFLVLVLLALFAYLLRHRGGFQKLVVELRGGIYLLGALTLWLVFEALFISKDTVWALGEINSQWIKSLIMCATGALVAATFADRPDKQRLLIYSLLVVTSIHLLHVDIQVVYQWWSTGGHGRLAGLTGNPARISFLANIASALLLAELYFRFRYRVKSSILRDGALAVAGILILIGLDAAQTRNAVLVLALMVVAWLVIYFRHSALLQSRWKYVGLACLLVLLVGSVFVATKIRPGVGAQYTFGTAVLAWDTERHRYWLDQEKYERPLLPSGEPVEIATYQRFAWLKQGAILAAENPLGVGFGRDAFSKAMQAKYNEGQPGRFTHWGILDLSIGGGWPAVAIWLAFIWTTLRFAWRRFRDHDSFFALALFFVVLDFGARMFIDYTLREQMLQQFMLLVGILTAMTALEKPRACFPVLNGHPAAAGKVPPSGPTWRQG